MKLQKQILAGVLFLAFAAAAFAAPATFDAAATAAVAESSPSDVFGVSVIPPHGDCAKAQAASADTSGVSDPWSTCGNCGPDICDGRPVGAICGGLGDNGRIMNCQDYLGMLCPIQDGIRCRCSSEDLP
jgi:hypothetical protein